MAAICQRDDGILLVEHEKERRRYWLLPGGGMHKGEPARDAVVREVFEETAVRVEPGRLLCVCESIFPGGERHIVHFIYETAHVAAEPAASQDARVRRSAYVPLDSLSRMELYPPLQQWLQDRLGNGFRDTPEYLGALWAQ